MMYRKLRSIALYIVFLGFLWYQNCHSVDSNDEQCYSVGADEVCYFRGSERLSNWSDAFQVCKANGSTLPTIRNSDYQYAFERYLHYLQSKKLNVSSIWTSGKGEELNEWTWIDGQTISDKSKRILHSGTITQTHVRISDNGSLIPADPDFDSPFFCQYYGERCNSRPSSYQLSTSCIVYNNYMEGWHDARDDCLFRGGDLAVLTDTDQQILKNLSNGKLTHFSSWIGLRKVVWFWITDIKNSTKEEITYSKWSRYAYVTRGDICVRIEAFNGKWMKSECRMALSVICQRKVLGVNITKPSNCSTVRHFETPNSSIILDLNGTKSSNCAAAHQFGMPISGIIALMLVAGVLIGFILCVIVGLLIKRRFLPSWRFYQGMQWQRAYENDTH